MNTRRKSMLMVLAILLVLPLMLTPLGAIGDVETSIWLGLLVAWLAVFLFWGRRTHTAA